MAGTLTPVEQTYEIYRQAPLYVDNIVLVAGVAQTVTAPVGSAHVIMSCTDNFFVRWNGGAASVPGVNVTNGDGSEINPLGRYIGQSTSGAQKTFSVIAPNDCVLALAYHTA